MTVVGGETVGGAFDASRIEAAVSELLAAIGEDVNRPGLQQTPARVAEAWSDFFSGVGADPLVHLSATSDLVDAGALSGELVLLRGIKFRSMCEHHLLPFLGTAHVGYVPRDRVVGLGKLPRVVDTLASRPQLQERLTEQIADALDSGLDPLGVIVVLEASHGCVTARGVQQTESTTVTLATRGSLSEPAARAEAIALIGSDHG
ncbi:GTP cyclohydrolase I FolE [Cryobacterium sp. BB307]|uniref:GTP cyclohydrolase I FolE n=1 Tax=unclassified Cryobacterium TaxID=2649013 RepID=UPI0032BFC2C4